MNRVHLVILWHMHQPQYREPATGRYVLPWTRLHALKDYWGMVRVLEETPGVHATFNMVPSLVAQLDEYASGRFREPWFDLAFAPADSVGDGGRREIVERAFQVNHENIMSRWPRYVEIFQSVQAAGPEDAPRFLSPDDLRDLQFLSQLAWMDEEYLEKDTIISELSKKGRGYTEEDKRRLRSKQLELLGRVLPEYRRAAESGQVELSTTPFYHPILPLVCDTDIARVANPYTPLPQPPFRNPDDAREQLVRAESSHTRHFGKPPAGLWPSEGSVSDQVLELAATLGYRWFATDEGVLGRTLKIGFWRDGAGLPENGEQLYTPWRFRHADREITGFFRDHYLSDLVGFVYSRMDASAAAEDLHRRIRAIGERVGGSRPATVSLILDGENAWEWYPRNGREFLRQFYGRIGGDPDIRALTASEAVAAAGEIPVVDGIFPASWINANFDIWIGHAEDVRAWELLREAREAYERAEKQQEEGSSSLSAEQLGRAFESVLAAEGSDWCWWYGTDHSSANDADFDALYRKHLTEIYVALGLQVPDNLSEPIKKPAIRAVALPPSAYLNVKLDGRETTYFEWLGAGYYAADRDSSAMHARASVIHEMHYGFSAEKFFVRVDFDSAALEKLRDAEFRVALQAKCEARISIVVREGRLNSYSVERDATCPLRPQDYVSVALDRILEIEIGRLFLSLEQQRSFRLGVALWQGGLPVDVLPAAGSLEVQLGEEAFAWPAE